jgi:hypothetical protein
MTLHEIVFRHQHIWRSGYVQWKKNKGFTQTSIYFDYLLGLNKIPCLLYEQLFIYTVLFIINFEKLRAHEYLSRDLINNNFEFN